MWWQVFGYGLCMITHEESITEEMACLEKPVYYCENVITSCVNYKIHHVLRKNWLWLWPWKNYTQIQEGKASWYVAVSLPTVAAELKLLKEKWVEACIAQFFKNLFQSTTTRRMSHGWTSTSKDTAKEYCWNLSPEVQRLWNEPKIKILQWGPTGVSKIFPKSHQVFFCRGSDLKLADKSFPTRY